MNKKRTRRLFTPECRRDMALMVIETGSGKLAAQIVLLADRGTEFTSRQLADYANQARIVMSMGKTGVCWDNAMAESFWATLKVEYHYRHSFRIHEEVYEGVGTWIEKLYSHKRTHSVIGYQSQIEYELNADMGLAV